MNAADFFQVVSIVFACISVIAAVVAIINALKL